MKVKNMYIQYVTHHMFTGKRRCHSARQNIEATADQIVSQVLAIKFVGADRLTLRIEI